ncbi:MAG TPA: Fic family protein [Tepidisphaeraceae bacterium]|nr:Fic family protein [Tepidisphaeraceae bacterium]
MPAVDVGVSQSTGLVIPGSSYRVARAHIDQLFEAIRQQLGQLELRWAQLRPDQRAMQLATVVANLVGGFIQIHPFINGNGRTSRLLWRWALLRFGVPVQCCTHPRPAQPYSQLMERAMHGEYRPLILYVLTHLKLHRPNQN